jgi:hypothetical protein
VARAALGRAHEAVTTLIVVGSIAIGAPGYQAVLQQATETGVEDSPEIQLWTSEDLYATSRHVTSSLSLLLNSIRWEGVTAGSS